MQIKDLEKGFIYIKPHHFLDHLYDLAIGDTHEGEENVFGSNNGILCYAFIKGLVPKIQFTPYVDDICRPCKKLVDGKRCTDFFDDATTENYGFRYKNDFNYQLDIKLNAALPDLFKFGETQNTIDVLHQLEKSLTETILNLYLWKRPNRYALTMQGVQKAIELYK